MQIIYFPFKAKDRLIARTFEDCIYDVVREKHGLQPLETKVGSGYAHMVLNGTSRIEDVSKLIDEITKEAYEHHRNLFVSEEMARIEYKQFLMTRLIENGEESVADLRDRLNDLSKLEFEKFIAEAKKAFEVKSVESMADVDGLSPIEEEIKLPSFKKAAVKGYELFEYGWEIEVKNVAEAIVASWLYSDFHDLTRFDLYKKGKTGYASGLLHKIPGKRLLVNFSVVAGEDPALELKVMSPASLFEEKKKEFLSKVKPEDFGLVDAFYQKVDWGERLSEKEFVNALKSATVENSKFFAETPESKRVALVKDIK